MTGDLIVSLLFIGGAMALVAGGIVRRGVGARQGATLALIWAGIFIVAFALARIVVSFT